MAENPLQTLAKACDFFSNSIKFHLCRLFPPPQTSAKAPRSPPFELSATSSQASLAMPFPSNQEKKATPLSKEELGRATWTLLHTIAAQYPDQPTRQQKRDAKELMAILSRLYPCKECADHFKEVLKANPVQAGSQDEFSQWLCHVHNVVNRSLGKLVFPCNRVNARWGKLDCKDRSCDLQGTTDLSKQ